MCASPVRKVLGRRLNTAHGLNPKKKIGISTTVVKCKGCGLVYADPLPVPNSVSDHYGLVPESYWHEEYFRIPENHFMSELCRIKHFVPHIGTFLDIGSGIGKTMRAVENAGIDAYGIEPGEEFRSRAISAMDIDPERISLASFEDAEFPAETFDCVSFGVVLEHLYNPSESLKKALRWLKPDGVIHIEVPDANYLFSHLFNAYFRLRLTDYVVNLSPMHNPFHLYEFTHKSFERNGCVNGYRVVHVDRYAGSTPVAPRLSQVLAPLMDISKTGMGLVVYLQKA
jgi:SAM-dependent methyltransferase